MGSGPPDITVVVSGCGGRSDTTEVLPPMSGYGLVLGRTGAHGVRRPDGNVVLDQGLALFGWPGLEVQTSHPLGRQGAHSCTTITFPPSLLEPRRRPDGLPTVVAVDDAVQLAHHRLLALAVRGVDLERVTDGVVALVDRLRHGPQPGPMADVETPAERAGRAIARDAQRALHINPGRDLTELAAEVGCSRPQLSRLFSRFVGRGVAAYRAEIRTSHALAGLADGAGTLADLAAATGFADHAHLARTIKNRFGTTPSALRDLLDQSLSSNSRPE